MVHLTDVRVRAIDKGITDPVNVTDWPYLLYRMLYNNAYGVYGYRCIKRLSKGWCVC